MGAGQKIKAPRGTEDILPEAWLRRRRIEIEAEALFSRAGYGRIGTPVFEDTDLFARGVGEDTDIVQKEMFTFEDLGGRSVTLRPEGTAAICRAYVEHGMHKLPQPVRLWYQGDFFRYEAPQAGRYRQFTQLGLEAIGSDLPEADAEAISLLDELVRTLGVPGVRLAIGSIGSADSRAAYRRELQEHLRKHEQELAHEVRERIATNPLRAFDSKDESTRAVMEAAPKLVDRLDDADAEHFEAVKGHLDALGIDYEVDPTLVRGLDYYTRTVFAIKCDRLGAQSEIGGGGRFDGLIAELGGPQVPAIGWAMGIERVLLALESESDGREASAQGADVFVAVADPDERKRALVFVHEVRRKGLSCEMDLAGRGLKGQFKQADRVGATYTVILEPDGGAQLKEMSSGEQAELDTGAILDRLVSEAGGEL